jgi:hypothetical protein
MLRRHIEKQRPRAFHVLRPAQPEELRVSVLSHFLGRGFAAEHAVQVAAQLAIV